MLSDSFAPRTRVVHGHERAYRMAGRGPAVLFLHGIGDDSSTWLELLTSLADDFTVIAPDLLGHGFSAKPRADYSVAAYACGMRDLLTTLDVDRVTVVGHSLGGGVAMQFAYQFPERCERLVLVGSGGVGAGVHPLLRLAAAPGAGLVLPLLGARQALPVLRGLAGLLRFSEDLDYVLARYLRLVEPDTRSAFLRTLRSVVDWRGQVVNMLDRCYLTEGIPTLLVWGTEDRVVPSGHALRAHRAMPGSRLVLFEGAGHFPHRSDPARFAEVLREFLDSAPAARYDRARWGDLLRAGRPAGTPDPAVVPDPAVSSGT
ncbi:alpha/beta hydrolase [Amycolatopsis sp. NPDC049159]|uniref:alpha/beta fold hydrolase n=2 Tax=unclassified Amycolatopsis TaxID=2618356 RepID=UPI00340D5520